MLGLAVVTAGTSALSTGVSYMYNSQLDQTRTIPRADLATGKDLTVRQIAVEQALMGVGIASAGLIILGPAVLQRRRQRQSEQV